MTAHDVAFAGLWAVIDRPYKEQLVPIFLLRTSVFHFITRSIIALCIFRCQLAEPSAGLELAGRPV